MELENENEVRIMEFCGGHTHQLVKSGLMSLLPDNLKMIHGPGCPVCVLPSEHIQAALDLLKSNSKLVVACFGDLMRIPTLGGDSLLGARSRGEDVRMVYDPTDLLKMAKNEPEKLFLFLAIGFETTAPATARLIYRIDEQQISNLKVYCLHVTTPPAIAVVMENLRPERRPMGLIGPGHVSLVTGLDLYHQASEKYSVPICISGFETNDLLTSLVTLVKSIKNKKNKVYNEYTRALKSEGNLEAQKLLKKVFEFRKSFYWRGLGEISQSAYKISPRYKEIDAEEFFKIKLSKVPEHKLCQCGSILRGEKSPLDCKLYAKACTPANPLGACMVSSEGTCSAYYAQGISV